MEQQTKTKEDIQSKVMHPTQAALGIWSGGHFMHFGVDIGAERLTQLVRHSYQAGIRTFITADVYGEGAADKLLGAALSEFERSTYCLIGAIGHDFYKGKRQGEKGFPRFTDPALRTPEEFQTYLTEAAEKSLERLGTSYFDLLLLHNPDSIAYTHEKVWEGLAALKNQGLTRLLGIAPGPANGFTLDLIQCFEKFGSLIDWAMIILNPLEPWPGSLVLSAAQKNNVKILTRVVDHGGLFHDQLKPGAKLGREDHRSFRPAGWIEAAQPKIERLREIAKSQDKTLLELACSWNLAQPNVKCVAPTLIQETGPDAKSLEAQARELASVCELQPLPAELVEEITRLGDNKNSMALKGGSSQYLGAPQVDQWPLTQELRETAKRWGIEPDRDLYYSGDLRDIRETGAPKRGIPQTSERRLYLQLQIFTGCTNPKKLAEALEATGIEAVLYLDVNDARGVGLLTLTENPEFFTSELRDLLSHEPFLALQLRPEFTMLGRSYSSGREMDLEDWLLEKPRRNALNPKNTWAIWYPLRRKSEFELLSKAEQGKILLEHAMIGRSFGEAGYAEDIRLACYGLDKNDNEFVLGVVGEKLYPLTRLIQEMRKTQQTAKYMQSLGPFFVGKVFWQSPSK